MARRAVQPEQVAAAGDVVAEQRCLGDLAVVVARHQRAAAVGLDVGAERVDLGLVERSAALRGACASPRIAGMRPVDTWKYTAASPTPIRLGPRSATPCRLAPWQVMQDVS